MKDFIILNQVVSKKTLMKNVHMCYIGVTEGTIRNLKIEGKMTISIFFFIYKIHFACLKVYTKFNNPKSSTEYLNKNSKGNLITLKHYVYSVSNFRLLGLYQETNN